DRARPPDDVHELHRQVAGRQGEAAGSRQRPSGSRQTDRLEDQAGREGRRRQQRPVSSTPAAMAGASAPALPGPNRRQAKKKAVWRRRRLVLLMMSPWILGFMTF